MSRASRTVRSSRLRKYGCMIGPEPANSFLSCWLESAVSELWSSGRVRLLRCESNRWLRMEGCGLDGLRIDFSNSLSRFAFLLDRSAILLHLSFRQSRANLSTSHFRHTPITMDTTHQENENGMMQRRAKVRHGQWLALAAFTTVTLVAMRSRFENDLQDEKKPVKWAISAACVVLFASTLSTVYHFVMPSKFVGTVWEGGMVRCLVRACVAPRFLLAK
jgi:hypothetical protein